MHISFSNSTQDLAEYSQMLRETEEGQHLARGLIGILLVTWLASSTVFGLAIWLISSSWADGLVSAAAVFVLAGVGFLLKAKFQPARYAWDIYTRRRSMLPPRHKDLLLLQRTLSFDDRSLRLETPLTFHEWHWPAVAGVSLTGRFVHITTIDGNQVLVPQRAFPSQEAFLDFARSVIELHEAGRNGLVERKPTSRSG